MTATPELPEHFFRHELGRLVSILSRQFGARRLELCEDAAQTALMRAVQSWAKNGAPAEPGAWLYRVARNHLLDGIRREKRAEKYVAAAEEEPEVTIPEDIYLESEVRDDLLRLLFVCVDPAIPPESQLVLALKTLCGFSTEEIALRLFQSTDAVHKKLQRARAKLRECPLELETPKLEALADRLPQVLHILYLVFNEGYSSAQPDKLIRRELCEEAVRLGSILVEHPVGAVPETNALLSLMYLHAGRFESRVDGNGGLLVLEEQDRSLWDWELIQIGLRFLQASAGATKYSRYHVEAAIAAEHCVALSYAATRWSEITALYDALEKIAPSPLNLLNRAIALAEWKGPAAALEILEALKPPAWLAGYYLWDATLGELYRRRGDRERAVTHLNRAREAAPTQAEKLLLERRLRACDDHS